MRPYGEDDRVFSDTRFNIRGNPKYDRRRYDFDGTPDGWEMQRAKQARRDFKILKLRQRKRARRMGQLEIEEALAGED